MKKESIPNELLNLLTEEEIIMFRELQIKIQELNYKTNLTRLIEGDDYWISQVYDSLWTFKENSNINFDNRKFPVWLDLANSLEGFREGVSELRTGNFTENSNGTISYDSFGVGIFFIPSGIGYFENTSAGIPEYSPLIFSVKLMTYVPTDHDSDGCRDSHDEDLDDDGDFHTEIEICLIVVFFYILTD